MIRDNKSKEPVLLHISPAGRLAVGLGLTLLSALLVIFSMPPLGDWIGWVAMAGLACFSVATPVIIRKRTSRAKSS